MNLSVNRRHFLKTVVGASAAVSLPREAASKVKNAAKQSTDASKALERLADDAITHGGIQRVRHPRLKVEVSGQTSIRYLRFGRPVLLDHLEMERLVYGRWVPKVPTHPAHLRIDTLDPHTLQWQPIREINLPYHPKIEGEGLSQEMTIEEMDEHFERILKEPPMIIPLDTLQTDHLRIVCDREHPVWPNHGECNGGIYNVPFGILNNLNAFGKPLGDRLVRVGYRPLLVRKKIKPLAPAGMAVIGLPDMLLFKGKYLSIGFSLNRPLLMHLGWDISGEGGAAQNRLFASRQPRMDKKMGGVSGPLLRTLYNDYPPHLWSGEVSVDGNKIKYSNLEAIDGLKLDVLFTVESDHLTIEFVQTCSKAIPVIDAANWRLAWDITKGITGMAGMPTLKSGRNGDVMLPALWASDGNGSLAQRLVEGDANETRLQVESYRFENCLTGGFVFGEHPGETHCQVVPEGIKQAVFELALENFQPATQAGGPQASDALKRHWGTVFSCFRPEYRGFSNHSASVNCHLSQGPPLEIVAHTRRPANGPNPLDLARYTIERALLDGGGYGYWRSLYLDSDPVLLSAAGRIHQTDPQKKWLKKIEPGLVETVKRMLSLSGKNGMLICKNLSGNSGSYRWSSNSMDVVGFGHIDGYVNAWAYRAFRNGAAMLDDLARYPDLVSKCRQAAMNLRENYAASLFNPDTGWVAGWRSRDGQLHDYAFIWVNGVALAFGLLDNDLAKKALTALELKRKQVGPPTARMGLPCNLLPIREQDQMLARILEDKNPTFETYTDGSLSGWPATYYLRALSLYGFRQQLEKTVDELKEGYAAGIFNGGNRSGHEFRSWEGLPTGYEGTLIGCFGPMYAIAIEEGVIKPAAPEWWPANG
jgi:hypothetical protein